MPDNARAGVYAKTTHGLNVCYAGWRTRCGIKAKFESLQARQGYKKSVIALAHKMLRIIYAMLSQGQPYQNSVVNYEELVVRRHAPRWLKMLNK